MKKTPLYEIHERFGGKIVDFAGWQLPVQYEGLKSEHLAVRASAGLFDVSHMGEIRMKGPKALESCEWLTSNSVSKLEDGQAQYTLLTNDQGGVVDDLIVYCLSKGKDYLLCVNAANHDKDLQWILKNNKGADIVDESEYWAQIAIQGPRAVEITKRALPSLDISSPAFTFQKNQDLNDTCLIARTGYTGEDGYEVFVPAELAPRLWEKLMNEGEEFSIRPCGLGARDTLRMEMKFPLYGNELNETTNPYSAGLGWVVKPDAKEFIGKSEILAGKAQGLPRKLIGFEMSEKGIPRTGYPILNLEGQIVGKTTSGTLSPCLEKGIGIGYVDKEFAAVGGKLQIQIRKNAMPAEIVKTPFYKK